MLQIDWPTYWANNMVHVRDLKVHQDDRGYLFEMIHEYDLIRTRNPLLAQFQELKLESERGRFGQVYVVGNPARGSVRAFHAHNLLWDYFCIVSGVAKFCFVDDRGKGRRVVSHSTYKLPGGVGVGFNPLPGDVKEIVVSGDRPKMIVVPPGVFHGWKSLVDNTLLLSVGSEVYNPSQPDEFRVPPNFFDSYFNGDPWEVKGR